MSASIAPTRAAHRSRVKAFLEPSIAPSPSPRSQGTYYAHYLKLAFWKFTDVKNFLLLGPVAGRNINTFPRHHHHHHRHGARTHAVTPSPSIVPGNVLVSIMRYLVKVMFLSQAKQR